ncbi:MAG: DUF4286 family protein [Ginsengibacter sp.]
MFVYNITLKVETQYLEEWMNWAKTVQIPDVLATGCFYDFRFYELMEIEEEDGRTFVIQFLANSKSDYNRYKELYHSSFRHRSAKKWGDHVVSFRTLLKNVE